MSWSEVLPNIQLEEALHFVAPATRIKEQIRMLTDTVHQNVQ